jgi:hypothetical protein
MDYIHMKNGKKQNILAIGDLVTLSSKFKKSRYKLGEAPLYQWLVGTHGYIVTGRLGIDQTAIIIRSQVGHSADIDEKKFKLLLDSGDKGWFCESNHWLVKNY